MMTYDDAVAYLNTLTNYEQTHQPEAMRTVPLSRMRALCARLGDPQTSFRSILVAGTNGKGSICAMSYEILRAAGLRVGLYTSPHLEDLRERIRISAECGMRPPAPSNAGRAGNAEWTRPEADWISPEAFAALIERMRPAIDSFTGSAEGPLTYFEALTAAAFLHFADRKVSIAVLEVGLGGRLDATNIAEPAVSVIGPIGLDHTEILGQDLLSIAGEKAAVMRPGRPVISAAQHPEVAGLLRERAAAKGCRLIECGQQVGVDVLAHEPASGLRVSVRGTRGRYEPLRVPLLGRHQADNALMAIAAVEALAKEGAPYRAVEAGCSAIRWPGRLELVHDRPIVLLDGAHNPPAARTLAQTLQELWPHRRKHLLLGISRDKAAQGIGEPLIPLASSVTCTKSRHPRAGDPQQLAESMDRFGVRAAVMPDARDACTYLLNTVDPEDMIVVTGSLFLVGELRTALAQEGRCPFASLRAVVSE